MRKIKLTLTGIVLIAIITAASMAQAATTGITGNMTVDSAMVVSTCTTVSFSSTFSPHSGQISPSCNVTAYSNDPDGFYITLYGTDEGFEHTTVAGIQWDKLPASDDSINTSCTSSCTEEWGWRIKNGTPTGYDGSAVQEDSDNPTGCTPGSTCHSFDDATYWHTVNYETSGGGSPNGAETIISQTSAATEGANFDVEFGATTDGITTAGSYEDTITITLIAL